MQVKAMAAKPDLDPQETQEWLDALDSVLENEGPDRAHFLLEKLIDKARRSGAYLPYSANTAYLTQHPLDQAGAVSRRPIHGTSHPFIRALECDGDGRASESLGC